MQRQNFNDFLVTPNRFAISRFLEICPSRIYSSSVSNIIFFVSLFFFLLNSVDFLFHPYSSPISFFLALFFWLFVCFFLSFFSFIFILFFYFLFSFACLMVCLFLSFFLIFFVFLSFIFF